MNPYDLTAAPFLCLYGLLLALCLFIALRVRQGEKSASPTDSGDLDPIQLAYLAGGSRRAIDAAVVGLMEAGAVTLNPKTRVLWSAEPVAGLPVSLAPFYQRIGIRVTIDWLSRALAPAVERVRVGLAVRGLAHDRAAARRLAWKSSISLWLLGAAGLARILLGAARDRPIGYITALTLITLLAAAAMSAATPTTSAEGARVVRQWRDRFSRVRRAPLEGELLLAFALTGGAVLTGTPYAAYARVRAVSDGGGCGGGGGGDGGGGCGGCGGH
jgi:uncharacterized protein (TIGR04222 family)